MDQLKIMLKRLKNPAVLTSIVSQIVAVLFMFNIEVDAEWITGIISAITSILVILGIMSNPDTKKQAFRDDIYYCPYCKKNTPHVMAGGKLLCPECGKINETIILP